jgi:hypothetical protein
MLDMLISYSTACMLVHLYCPSIIESQFVVSEERGSILAIVYILLPLSEPHGVVITVFLSLFTSDLMNTVPHHTSFQFLDSAINDSLPAYIALRFRRLFIAVVVQHISRNVKEQPCWFIKTKI